MTLLKLEISKHSIYVKVKYQSYSGYIWKDVEITRWGYIHIYTFYEHTYKTEYEKYAWYIDKYYGFVAVKPPLVLTSKSLLKEKFRQLVERVEEIIKEQGEEEAAKRILDKTAEVFHPYQFITAP